MNSPLSASINDEMRQQISSVIAKQRQFFKTGETLTSGFREHQLQILKDCILTHEEDILQALNKDLNKSEMEAYATEVGLVLDEIRYMQKNLGSLMSAKNVATPTTHFPAKSFISYEPYGVVLNIAPWNYPFQLAVAPIVGAIAAGNTVIIKPSEYAVHTSNLLAKIINQYFDDRYVAVIEGGVEVNQTLLEHKFDYIFFTGSVPVGKIIMQAASQYLTPITLELGGKSPCIVDETADLALVAKRIMWGKTLNCGQTCIAPDYLLVHEQIKDGLLTEMQNAIQEMFGDNPLQNSDYPKMISERHYQRVKAFLQDGQAVIGGQCNDETWQISPTVLDGVDWDSPVMQEEIFGAILPILTFNHIQQAIEQINQRPKPLALYLFTNDNDTEDEVLSRVSFGGGCVNDTLMQIANHHLPFGGVGESGMGAYHGEHSFYTFSHAKSIVKRGTWLDIPVRYPPYTKQKFSLIKKLVK